MDTKLTPAMARQLALLTATGTVRETVHGRSITGLTSPVLTKLLRMGLVVLSQEIATYTYQPRGCHKHIRETAHAVLWTVAA